MSIKYMITCDLCKRMDSNFDLENIWSDGWEIAYRSEPSPQSETIHVCPKCADDLGWS